MKKFTALLLAASMTTAAASTAIAMTDQETVAMGRAMLTGAIYNTLTSSDYDPGVIDKLTLGEIAAINSILNSGEASSGQAKQRVDAILQRADER